MKTAWSLIAILILFANHAHAGKFDPLNASERELSRNAANKHNSDANQRNSKDGFSSILRKKSLPKYKFLLAERHRANKGASDTDLRLADVYWYDYSSDTLLVNVVDLANKSIVTSSTSQGTQLPLTEDELGDAVELLFADPFTRERVAEEYKKTTGNPLSDYNSQIEIRAFVFHAETASGQLQPGSINCGINRCAQMMIYTPDNLAIDIMPIVNLSKQKITDILASF